MPLPYRQIEIKIRYKGTNKQQDAPVIDTPAIAAEVARNIANHNTILWQEEAFILCLNSENRLLGWYRIAIGGMESVSIDSRIIGTIALKCIASSVILTHNHPSGNPTPTKADIKTTTQVKSVLDIIGVRLQDHIIITDTAHFSMKENGYL